VSSDDANAGYVGVGFPSPEQLHSDITVAYEKHLDGFATSQGVRGDFHAWNPCAEAACLTSVEKMETETCRWVPLESGSEKNGSVRDPIVDQSLEGPTQRRTYNHWDFRCETALAAVIELAGLHMLSLIDTSSTWM
jgi:hypothetical protein